MYSLKINDFVLRPLEVTSRNPNSDILLQVHNGPYVKVDSESLTLVLLEP